MHKLAPIQPDIPADSTFRPMVLLSGCPWGNPVEGGYAATNPVLHKALSTFRLLQTDQSTSRGGNFHPESAEPPKDSQPPLPLKQLLPPLAPPLALPLAPLTTSSTPPSTLPGTAWAGFLAYDLIASIEPIAHPNPHPHPHPRSTPQPPEGRPDDTGGWADDTGKNTGGRAFQPATLLPLVELHRIDLSSLPSLSTVPPQAGQDAPHPPRPRPVLRAAQGKAAYTASVARALDYIRAGDIYQANIAHQFTGRYTGSAPALFAALTRTAQPRHGLCFTSAPLPDDTRYAILSLSPELFLSFDARTRRLTTRPMKGTRPGHADPAELRNAAKDRAELAMIVDLMRNDLGRVCEFGSIEVECARTIEHHGSGTGSVLQATATIAGTVREGLSTTDILAATFPPGSVTGTPKIRAMQIIHELEPFARGPYCGCLGIFADDGSFELAVAIRTAVIHGRVDPATGEFLDAEFSYCVGAGIVADSDPEAEWQETLDKARVLEAAFDLDL